MNDTRVAITEAIAEYLDGVGGRAMLSAIFDYLRLQDVFHGEPDSLVQTMSDGGRFEQTVDGWWRRKIENPMGDDLTTIPSGHRGADGQTYVAALPPLHTSIIDVTARER